MHDTTIGCVIPVKNRSGQIVDAIESVLAQSKYVDAIIVVNDGSRDGTEKKVRDRFPQVTVINTQNAGPGMARNIGALRCPCDVLLFLDSDDIWLENHVKDLVAPILQGYSCSFGLTINDGPCIEETFTIPGREFSPERPMEENLFRWCSIVPSSFAMSRADFLKTGGFPATSFGEDWLFFAKLALDFQIHYVPKEVTIRRIHGENLCWRTFSQKQARSLMKHLRKLCQGIDHKHLTKYIDKVIQLIDKEGQAWKNVQDWYRAMERTGLI